MFELEDPDTLRHRQDVRRLMRTMLDDPAARRSSPRSTGGPPPGTPPSRARGARAEQLYHRLMGGEDPRTLDRLWSPPLNPLLASAMEEPLPDRARSWLGRRLGLVTAGQEPGQWDQEDWRPTRPHGRRRGSPPATPRCLEVLAEQAERLEGSHTPSRWPPARPSATSSEARRSWSSARSAISSGDRAAQLELLERGIRLRALQGDGPGVVDAARSAVALTDVTGQRARGIRPSPTPPRPVGPGARRRGGHAQRRDLPALRQLRPVGHAQPAGGGSAGPAHRRHDRVRGAAACRRRGRGPRP